MIFEYFSIEAVAITLLPPLLCLIPLLPHSLLNCSTLPPRLLIPLILASSLPPPSSIPLPILLLLSAPRYPHHHPPS